MQKTNHFGWFFRYFLPVSVIKIGLFLCYAPRGRKIVVKNRDLKVEIRMDLLDLGGEDPDQGDSTGVQVSKDGTYTRKFDFYRAGQILISL